jgi:hypothetical protein
LLTIAVIETSSVSGGEIERHKIPANVTFSPADFGHKQSSHVAETIAHRVPSVFVNDATGKFFQPNAQYCGFVTPPVVGTRQRLAGGNTRQAAAMEHPNGRPHTAC